MEQKRLWNCANLKVFHCRLCSRVAIAISYFQQLLVWELVWCIDWRIRSSENGPLYIPALLSHGFVMYMFPKLWICWHPAHLLSIASPLAFSNLVHVSGNLWLSWSGIFFWFCKEKVLLCFIGLCLLCSYWLVSLNFARNGENFPLPICGGCLTLSKISASTQTKGALSPPK